MSRDARKKERQRLKRKQKKMAMRRIQSRTALQRIAAEGGRLECWITPDWREKGMASVQVFGHARGGRAAFAAFLVDLWCVGLKDAFGRSDVPELEFREDNLEPWIEQTGTVPIDPMTVRRLVAGAIRFSRQNGFRLPPHWEKWVTIFGRDILAELPTADVSEFGIDGGLRYVGTMDFLRQRLIGCTVHEFLNRPDMHFVLGPGELPLTGELEDEDYEEDETDDEAEEAEDDEESSPDMMEVLGATALQLASAVREWCFANAVPPREPLDKAALIALAATLPIAAGVERGGKLENMPAPEALMDRLVSTHSPDQRQQILDAIEQIRQYMGRFDSPERMLQAIGSSPAAGNAE